MSIDLSLANGVRYDAAMRELARETWSFILYEHEGRLLLNVVAGTVGLFEVLVELTAEERAAWERDGVAGVQPLVRAIQGSPRSFWDRRVERPEGF